MKQKGGRFRPLRSLKRIAKKTNRAVHKASRNRFVKAARRAADYGVKQVPYVGNAYALADLGVRGARAARKGNLKKFIAKEAAMGLATTLAPQAMAAYDYNKTKADVAKALITGKGPLKKIKAHIKKTGKSAKRHANMTKKAAMVIRRRR